MYQRPYEKLVVWQEAHKLCLWTYEVVGQFPEHEKDRLADQMLRSSSSVSTNIAEGCTKSYLKDRRKFYDVSNGSLEELHYQFRLARDLTYIGDDIYLKAEDHIRRTSYLLIRLRQSTFKK